jgi:hypothetical protein
MKPKPICEGCIRNNEDVVLKDYPVAHTPYTAFIHAQKCPDGGCIYDKPTHDQILDSVWAVIKLPLEHMTLEEQVVFLSKLSAKAEVTALDIIQSNIEEYYAG